MCLEMSNSGRHLDRGFASVEVRSQHRIHEVPPLIRRLFKRVSAMQKPISPQSRLSAVRVCEKIVRKTSGAELATILQLSDLHLLAKTPLRGKPGHGSFLLDLERALRAQKDRFDLVVVTGDLIDASEFRASSWKKAFVKASEVVSEVCRIVEVDPEEGLLVIPGNHDVRRWGMKPKWKLVELFRDHFGRFFVHSFYPNLGLLVACFDSNEQVRPLLFDFAKGMAPTAQCDAVMRGIEELRGPHQGRAERAFRMALIHHHLMAIPSDDFAADTKIIGAPSLMMLRNAGSFLQRLLRDGYRLILHGHLHTHGYWLPQTFFSDDESPRWLELISCAWSGVSGGDNVRAFNVVKVHNTGVVQSRRVEFRASEIESRPIQQAMAGYNLVRTRSWDLRERKSDSVVCDTYSQRWDVILPAGDILVTDVIRGLRGEVDEVGEMEVFKEATGLTLFKFSAEFLGPTRRSIPYERYEIKRNPPHTEEPRIGFRLKFQPNLGSGESGKVDIILRSTILGGIASSREDQEYSQVGPRKLGKEEIYHEVQRACGRLVVNIRFFAVASEAPELGTEASEVSEAQEALRLVPERVDLRVYDPGVRIAPFEQGSDHITWDFWSSDRESKGIYDLPSVPEATLSVYRPQLHYGYALEWDLPDLEPIQERESLQNQRTRLLEIERNPTAFAAAQAFVAALKEYVRVGLRAEDPSPEWDDESLGVHLYAFDGGNGEMVRKWRDSFHGDLFPSRIAYGRDFIGTSFRSWYPHSYNGVVAAGDPLPFFDRIREEWVKYLFACPLWRSEWVNQVGDGSGRQEPLDIAPVGVVGIASGVAGSGLGSIISHEDARKGLHRQIVTLWRACQVRAGWAPRS